MEGKRLRWILLRSSLYTQLHRRELRRGGYHTKPHRYSHRYKDGCEGRFTHHGPYESPEHKTFCERQRRLAPAKRRIDRLFSALIKTARQCFLEETTMGLADRLAQQHGVYGGFAGLTCTI